MTKAALPPEAPSAEYYSKLYMKQPYGGKSTMAFRHVLALIRAEMTNPLRRCPECEEPGYPTLLEWPERSHYRPKSQIKPPALRARYALCVWCGHKISVPQFTRTPGARRALTPEQEKEVCQLYLGGWNSNQIAKHLFCSSKVVLRALEDNGVKRRPTGGSTPLRGIPREELMRIHYLYEVKGLHAKQVAREMGMTEGTVYHRLKRMREIGWLPERQFRRRSQELRKRARARRAAMEESEAA